MNTAILTLYSIQAYKIHGNSSGNKDTPHMDEHFVKPWLELPVVLKVFTLKSSSSIERCYLSSLSHSLTSYFQSNGSSLW